ncbi:MAG: hypothetical protein E6H94_09370 [Chloroflexi bacterium]|nr:MAG: hypothetical protein E6H94_09370 [Chloroflexota bacterium]
MAGPTGCAGRDAAHRRPSTRLARSRDRHAAPCRCPDHHARSPSWANGRALAPRVCGRRRGAGPFVVGRRRGSRRCGGPLGKRRRAVRDVVGPADAAGRGERAPVLPCLTGRAPFHPPDEHRRRRRDRRAVSRAHGVIGQRGLVALALAAGALAGILYYAGARRTTVIVAARDLDATHALAVDDLTTRELPTDAIPADAVTELAKAVGRTPAAFHTGLTLPSGLRAVALPVSAAQAVGGALVPGARVDVLAVPLLGRAPAGRTTELLAQSALVLDVRAETGAPYGATAGRTGLVTAERIGSVVVAIAPTEELRFADRIATSTFVLAAISAG